MPVVLATGCLVYFSLPEEPLLVYGVVPCFLGLTGMLVIRRFYPAFLGGYQFCCLFFLLGGGFCLAWLQTHHQESFYRLSTRAVYIQGDVQQVEWLANGKRRLSVGHVNFLSFPESEQKPWSRQVRFTLLSSDQHPVETGDRIQVKVRLNHPFPPARIGEYDLQFYAWFHAIGAYGYALGPVDRIRVGHKTSLQSLREKIATHIARVLPDSSGAIAEVLLTGMGGRLSPEDRHDFAVAGLAHLLAIAGLHLGTVMVMVSGITRWVLVRNDHIVLYWPVRRIALFAGWGAGCLYLLLTGFHLPAVRSLIMASMVILALFFGRRAISMHNLMLAALFILVCSPASVLNVSFQMSMAAVMVLITGYRYGYDLFLNRWKTCGGYRVILFYLGESIWVSLLAGLAVCPIVMAHFHEMDLYFVFANLIAVPLMVFWILPMGMLFLSTMPCGYGDGFLRLMGYGIDLVLYTARMVSRFPHAVIDVQNMPSWGLALYFLGLCILCLCVTRIRIVGFFLMGIGVLSCLFFMPPDLVLSADGQMIGVRHEGKLLLVCQRGCNSAILEAWRKYLGSTERILLSSAVKEKGVVCHDFYCRIVDRHLLIILKKPENQEIPAGLCHSVFLEVSVLWNQPVCPLIPLIDKRSSWTQGAQNVWLDPLKIRTDLSVRGNRPWVIEPANRGVPNLPIAPSE